MTKKLTLKFLSLPLIISIPSLAISCSFSYPDDKENITFNDSSFNGNKDIKINLKNPELKEIEKIYKNNILNLISDVKNSFRDYKQKYLRLLKKYKSLKKKIYDLIPQQDEKNGIEIQKFYNKWLDEDEAINLKPKIKKERLALLLDKYQLIFSDVDTVIGDLNLNIDNKQFLKRMEIIEKRLKGIDINLGSLQENIISSWVFLKNNVFDLSNITKKENIEKINLDDDQNSHTHSHAIVNLVYEMGLWHQTLTESYKNNSQLSLLKKDFETLKKNIIINIDQLDYESDFNFIIKTLEKNFGDENIANLINKKYQDNAKDYMDKIKKILLDIAKKEGIKDIEIKPFLDWKPNSL